MIDKDVIVFFFKSKMIKNGQNPGNYSVFSSVVLFNSFPAKTWTFFTFFQQTVIFTTIIEKIIV